MTADIGSGPPPAPPSRWASWRHELGEEGARGALVAFVATLVFLGVGLYFVLNSSSWPKVQQQFFNPEDFFESWPDVLGGFWLDIKMFVVAEVLILAFGSVLAMGLPISVALGGVGVGGGIVALVSHITSIPDLATIIGAMATTGMVWLITAQGIRPRSSVRERTMPKAIRQPSAVPRTRRRHIGLRKKSSVRSWSSMIM